MSIRDEERVRKTREEDKWTIKGVADGERNGLDD